MCVPFVCELKHSQIFFSGVVPKSRLSDIYANVLFDCQSSKRATSKKRRERSVMLLGWLVWVEMACLQATRLL